MEFTSTTDVRIAVTLKPLPCCPPPFEDELLSSWIMRLAQANHCSFKELNGYLGFDKRVVPTTVGELDRQNLHHLSIVLQQPADKIAAMTLPYGKRFDVQFVSGYDFQKCAVCTSRTPGLILRHWRFAWSTSCERCGEELVGLDSKKAEFIPEKFTRRVNRGAVILRSAFLDDDWLLCRRIGRAFYMMSGPELEQFASVLSENKFDRFTVLAAIGMCLSSSSLKVVPVNSNKIVPVRHLKRVFPNYREIIMKIVLLSEISDNSPPLCFMIKNLSQNRTDRKPVEEVSSPALIAARQAIKELGLAANQSELLARAEAIFVAKRKTIQTK